MPPSALIALAAALAADSAAPAPTPLVVPLPAAPAATWRVAARDTTPPARPRAVDVSEGYERRLTIHRWGSYVMVPLFAAQYVLGDRLLDQKEAVFSGRRTTPVDEGVRDAHLATAVGVGALFAVNTVTGVWNWYESRGTAEKRGLRAAHALLMLAADVGFVATGAAGRRATDSDVDAARRHRNVALASVGVSAASAAMMLIFNRD
jgi:hypothetical protein